MSTLAPSFAPRKAAFAALRRAALVLALVGCRRDSPPPDAAPPGEPITACPSTPVVGGSIEGLRPEHRTPEFWSAKLAPGLADAVVVDADAIAALDQAHAELEGSWQDPRDRRAGEPGAIEAGIAARLDAFTRQVERGELVEGRPGAMHRMQAAVAGASEVDHLRLVVAETPLYCIPTADGLYKLPVDHAFDRNRCASLRPGELVRVLRRAPEGWLYVHAGYTLGWVFEPALSDRLSKTDTERWFAEPRVISLGDDVRTTDGFAVRIGVAVPLVEQRGDGSKDVLVPIERGTMRPATLPAGAAVSVGPPPLSRRALWALAFGELDAPYGWGGRAGARDCSRFVRDLFAAFGIQLARHSGVQALQGTRSIDVSMLDEAGKRDAIAREAEHGIVLLYMPGHIMLYLGRDGGRDYAISAISEYLTPCPGGPDTVHRIDRVEVTPLDLGAGTSRTAFLERITRLVVFRP